MKKCLKCGVSPVVFKTTKVLDVDVLVDEFGYIIEKLKYSDFQNKYGSLYICISCEAEYVRIDPLMLHSK